MSSSKNPDVYEEYWTEVYTNMHEDYVWEFETKKEAERVRFRALGFCNAVRYDATLVDTLRLDNGRTREVPRSGKWISTIANMAKREHVVNRLPNGSWELRIRTRVKGAMFRKEPARLQQLTPEGLKKALASAENAEAAEERATEGEEKVQTKPRSVTNVDTAPSLDFFKGILNTTAEKK